MISLIVILISINFSYCDYCNPTFCPNNGEKHVACDNSGGFASNCGSNATTNVISNADQAFLLELFPAVSIGKISMYLKCFDESDCIKRLGTVS